MNKGKTMTSKTTLEPAKQSSHRPFVIRKTIVFSAVVFAVVGGVLFGNPVLGIALYFGLATLFDAISYYALDLKSSDFADPEALLKSERVTKEEFDAYFDTRRNIRLNSFCAASIVLSLAFVNSFYPLEAFCLLYILSTIAGILYVRMFGKINRPRLIYRDDRYYVPRHGPRPGYITMAQFALASSGSYPYGPVDH